MVLGIGCDIIEIKRIEKAIEKDGFLQKYFTNNEIELINIRGKNNAETAAGNFCAKEAVAKALGCGFGNVAVKDIEVLRNNKGEPYILLHGNGRTEFDRLLGSKILISISHSRETAMAFAVIEGGRANVL